LLADPARIKRLAGGRVGLLANRTSLTTQGVGTAEALAQALQGRGQGLVRLFAPEHGWSGGEPDGMQDAIEPATGLPVHSLYGPRRRPEPDSLRDLDIIIVDLQDVGVRCYTYGVTSALLLRAFAELPGKQVLICDRANPLGPAQAGPRLDPRLRSFIGYFDLPFVHGLSLGGILRDWAAKSAPGLSVDVVEAPETLSPPAVWIPPSPSLGGWDAARLYPGLVLLEGTNVSEGRGTPHAFRSVLAPGLEAGHLAGEIGSWNLGVIAKVGPNILPSQGKFADKLCSGVLLAPIDDTPKLAFGVRLLDWLKRNYAEFAWRKERVMATSDGAAFSPTDGTMIDYLIGNSGLRSDIDAGVEAKTLVSRWAS
jgi:uncharacterized protein YbbC (DUF1343 family)